MTNVDLAKRVGISAPPCLRRLKNLEDGGVIQGYQANLNPKSLSYNITLFASVGLKENSEAQLSSFEKAMHGMKHGGPTSSNMKAVGRNMARANNQRGR